MKQPLLRVLLSAGTALSAASLAGCGKPPGPPPSGPTGTPQVAYLSVQPERLPLKVELPGRTAPIMLAEVRPQVNGIIKARLFKEGASVKAGQLLYQIDPAIYDATADSAKASLARAEAQLGVSKLKASRTAELVSIKAVSLQDADDANAALKQAQADVLSARATLQSATIDLDHTRVTSPIAGRIGRSAVTAGALVTANQVTALATVQQLDPINVDLTQSSSVLLKLKQLMADGKVQPGAAKVTLLLDENQVYATEGRLQFSEATVDSGTSAVVLRAEFPNPAAQLLPGMYVRAVVEAGVVEQALLVPQRAVSRDAAGGAVAFVVTADNKLERRVLVTPRAFGERWLVTEGLQAGDRVVVQGLDKAQPGTTVDPKPYEPTRAPQAPGDAVPAGKS